MINANSHFLPTWLKESIIRDFGYPLDDSKIVKMIDMRTLNKLLESIYNEGYEKGYWQGQLSECEKCDD